MEKLNDIVSLIILAIFAYYVIKGYRKGFVKQAAFVINTILALILASVLMPVFMGALHQLQITESLEKIFNSYLNAYYISHTVSGIRLQDSLADTTVIAADEITRRILVQNAGIIAGNITRAVSYSLGFISIRILLHFVFNVAAFIAALPIIHEFDKAIGALSGGFMTLLSLWIIISLMSMLSFIPGGGMLDFLLELPIIHAIKTVNPFQLMIQTLEMIKG